MGWFETLLAVALFVFAISCLSSIDSSLKRIAWAQELAVCVDAVKVRPDFKLPKTCLEEPAHAQP